MTGAAAGKLKTVLNSEAANSSFAADASSLSSTSSVARSGIAPVTREIVSLDRIRHLRWHRRIGRLNDCRRGRRGRPDQVREDRREARGRGRRFEHHCGRHAEGRSVLVHRRQHGQSWLDAFLCLTRPAGRVSRAVSVTKPVVATAPTRRTPATRIVWP